MTTGADAVDALSGGAVLPVAALLFGTVTTTDVSPLVTVKVEPVGIGVFPVPVTIGATEPVSVCEGFDVIESNVPVTSGVVSGRTDVTIGGLMGLIVGAGFVTGPVTPVGMTEVTPGGFTEGRTPVMPPVGLTVGMDNPPVPVIVGKTEAGWVTPLTPDWTEERTLVRTLVMSVPGSPVTPVPIGRPPVGRTLATGPDRVGSMPPVGSTLGTMLPSGRPGVVSGPELPVPVGSMPPVGSTLGIMLASGRPGVVSGPELPVPVGNMPPVGSTLGSMLCSGPPGVESGPELPLPESVGSMRPVGTTLGTILFSKPDGVLSGPELPVPGKVKVGTVRSVV